MDYLKILCSFLFTLITCSPAQATPEINLGVAFIHGTNDHRQDADGTYWKKEMTLFLNQALANPDNSLVVNCDYRQFMWKEEAGGCTSQQLADFIEAKKINKLVVITHSNGGNVMRWIMSNPTFHPNHQKILNALSEVIALAPSSAGSPLADEITDGNAFEAGLAWLVGYNNDAVQQQRPSDMLIYNDNQLFGTSSRPSLPRPFKAVIGSDVTASPFNGASYCNGYWLNAALKVTKIYLEACADGFLNCSSQASAGEVWFKDTEVTEDKLNLSHNQSRHSCFGLEKKLAEEISLQGASA